MHILITKKKALFQFYTFFKSLSCPCRSRESWLLVSASVFSLVLSLVLAEVYGGFDFATDTLLKKRDVF